MTIVEELFTDEITALEARKKELQTQLRQGGRTYREVVRKLGEVRELERQWKTRRAE